MSEKAYITPIVLKWARISAKMSEEIASKKINVSSEKLINWENGVGQPTIKQAQNLAKAYRRPFSLFFLPEIPNDFQPLQDFRKNDSQELGTASTFIIREIQQKQSWISEFNRENEEEPIEFVGKYSITSNPTVVANDILKTFEINPLNYIYDNPIKEWIEKIEAKGVFVSRTSFIHSKLKLSKDEIQGFAIADPFAPFIFVNSEDWNAPQLFTLIHELVHIWIAESGVSNIDSDKLKVNENNNVNQVELFCNEVAGNILMPQPIINGIDSSNFLTSKEIFKSAKDLGVSTFAFLFRIYNLNRISLSEYKKLKSDAEIEYTAFLKREADKKIKQKEKEKKGGPNYYRLQLNKNSKLFTQIVLDAFRGGNIEPTRASALLNVQINKFPKLEAQMYNR